MNPWWGCRDCGWASDRIRNTSDPRDRFNEEEPADEETKPTPLDDARATETHCAGCETIAGGINEAD